MYPSSPCRLFFLIAERGETGTLGGEGSEERNSKQHCQSFALGCRYWLFCFRCLLFLFLIISYVNYSTDGFSLLFIVFLLSLFLRGKLTLQPLIPPNLMHYYYTTCYYYPHCPVFPAHFSFTFSSLSFLLLLLLSKHILNRHPAGSLICIEKDTCNRPPPF